MQARVQSAKTQRYLRNATMVIYDLKDDGPEQQANLFKQQRNDVDGWVIKLMEEFRSEPIHSATVVPATN